MQYDPNQSGAAVVDAPEDTDTTDLMYDPCANFEEQEFGIGTATLGDPLEVPTLTEEEDTKEVEKVRIHVGKARKATEALVRYTATREDADFAEFVNICASPVLSYALTRLKNPEDAEDALQYGLCKLAQNPEFYNPNHPSGASALGYLRFIVANRCKDIYNKNSRKAAVSLNEIEQTGNIEHPFEVIGQDNDPSSALLATETSERIQAVVEELPEKWKEILVLARFQQFSYKQMADILNIPIGTVKSRLSTAMKHFGKAAEEAGLRSDWELMAPKSYRSATRLTRDLRGEKPKK